MHHDRHDTHAAHDAHTRHDAHGRHDGHGTAGQSDHHDHHAMMVTDFRRRFWVSLVATVPILALSPMLQEWFGLRGAISFPGDTWVLLTLATFVFVYGGKPFLTGLVEEVRRGNPGMMTLVGLAISVAYFYSLAVVLGLTGMLFFWETATLIDLMLLGHWIEMRSVMGASRALEELARLMPAEAHLVGPDGDLVDVPVSSLQKGQHVRIKSGEKFPADGKVVEGNTSVDEGMLTGESRPVDKSVGDEVIGGSINGSGSVVVEISKTGNDSYLNQVITLVREAQQSKSKTQDLANRAAYYLTLVAIAVGATTFVVWFWLVDAELTFAIERAVTVMVITCPHALGLAVPLVVAVSTSISARRGLLIRNRAAFEQARLLDTIVFDKTGTLTEGRFGVTDVLLFGEVSESRMIGLAAAVEANSEHPIAAGILRSADDREVAVPSATDFRALAGKGVQAMVDRKIVRVLSPGAVEAERLSTPNHNAEQLGKQGKTVVYVANDDQVIGALALADVVRKSSSDAVSSLHAMGIDVVMLTGDRKEVAGWVGQSLGLDRVIAEVLPHEKSKHIKSLQDDGHIVAMTGDGVNDAPALATADVGIAIGAGTDVAVETADIVLVNSDPRDAVQVIRLARATYRKMVQNLWYAAGYNIVAIPLAAGVFAWAGLLLSPAVGAVLMSLSTVVVAINARLLKID